MSRSAATLVRPATTADRAFLLDLAARVFAGLGDYRRILGHWLESAGAAGWIASEEEENVGVGMALVTRRLTAGFRAPLAGELVAIAVTESRRGAGLGRELLAAAERTAVGWGAVEMRLHTAAANARARSFFAAAGYRPTGARGLYPSGLAALEMSRPLAGAGAIASAQARSASSISR
jgi:GNAT superfamily N-acetyltransferase